MKKHFLAAAVAAVTLPLSPMSAYAQTAFDTMGVSMTVAAECTLETDPVAFGNQTLIDTAVPIAGNMTVQCTSGAPYQIALSAGSGLDATADTRFMTGAVDGQLATYTVHQGAATGPIWGFTLGTDTLDSVGATGGQEVLPFTAVLAAGQSVSADTYADTLTATINY